MIAISKEKIYSVFYGVIDEFKAALPIVANGDEGKNGN